MNDYISIMNSDIRRLVMDAIKVSIRKPRQLRFLKAFMDRTATAQAVRDVNELKGLHVPPFLIASITTNCNLFCAGCYARANQSCGSNQAGELLGHGRWELIFEEADRLGVCFILLAGGEPLLRPDVLNAAAAHGSILFPVFTNGTLIGGKYIAFFDQHRNLLPILSLEGGKEATDTRRGSGVHDQITAAMKVLKAQGILFGVSVTVTKHNIAEVTSDRFVKSLKRSGCSIVFYVEYVPVESDSVGLAPVEADRQLLEQRVASLKQTCNMLVISFPGDEKLTGGCLAAGRGFVHINSDGSVEPCPFSPYSDINLSDHSLEEALQSPFLAGMREDGFLLGEHKGGCLLFDKRKEVEELLEKAKQEN